MGKGGGIILKRDMELVRKLFFMIENQEDDRRELVVPKEYDKDVVAYHLKILDQAGYVESNITYASNSVLWMSATLTWEGHEFLDSIKNDNIWRKTKEGIKEKGFELGNVPFEILKEFASLQLKNFFGLN